MDRSPFAAARHAGGCVEKLAKLADGIGSPRAVVGVCLCGVFAFINLYLTQPLLPLFERLFSTTKSMVGLTVSAATLGVAISAPLIGVLAERMNRRRLIIVSTLVLSVLTLLAAASPGLHTMIVWRFFQGLALPGVFGVTIAYIGEEWHDSTLPLVMSLYVSSTALGGLSGRIVAGVLAERLSWRWSFLVPGLLTMLGAALIAWLLPAGQHVRSERSRTGVTDEVRAMFAHFRDRRLAATFAAGFLMLFALVATFTYITFYLAASPFGLSTEALSYLFAIYLIGLVVTPVGGLLVGKIGMRAGMTLAMCIALAGVLLTLSHGLWTVILAGLGMVTAGFFIGQSTANSFLAIAAPPGGRASAAGIYVCCYYIGGTVGGVVPAYFWSVGEWPACVGLIACAFVAALVIALMGWGTQKASSQIA